ncbi:MAG: hypothetical protein C4K48_11405 [Candidatus Thorarchaeota archaeon]|nr:MAG: hypothetical protein C4K48_11405 [Candidatus Thorarchaeota archaeon]
MIEMIIVGILFLAGILLYALARVGGMLHHPSAATPSEVTSSEKLFDSKTNDATFFDGESEDYAETMSRLRTYGGG